MTTRFLIGDVLAGLATIPDNTVDLIVSSPPFLALRSYLPAEHPDKGLEIGSEATPGEFLDRLLDVVEECARVLAPHGSLVFELGDTYAGSNPGSNGHDPYYGDGRHNNATGGTGWPLDKSKVLVPQLFAIALAYGFNPLTGRTTDPWRIRNVVSWNRPNPPVGRDGDKFRPATSFLTVATKARDRYWDGDAVRVPPSANSHARLAQGVESRPNDMKVPAESNRDTLAVIETNGAPLLDYWVIPTEPYSGSHYACVDDQTEALTLDGWKRHDELENGERIAAYDAERGVTTWQPATFHRYPFSGDLVAIEQRETSQRLTPNHRVLHRTARGFLRTRRADEARPSWRVPVAAPFDGGAPFGPGEVLAALLGWYVTEGSAGARTVKFWQSESANPKHCNRIRDLLDAAGADYTERRRVRPVGATISPRESVEVSWTVRGKVAAWLLAAAPNKRLPAEVLSWLDEECYALLDALVDGDGHTRPSGRRQFIQNDRGTVDMVQGLCCRLGLRSTISQRLEGTYSLTIGERSWLSLRGTNGESRPVGREHYDGIVWCPSVPTGYWLARRNGRPFITGNTFPRALVVPLVKSMCPQKVCRVCGEPSRRIVGDAEYVGGLGAGTNAGKPADPEQFARVRGKHEGVRFHDKASSPLTRVPNTLGWTDCGHDTWRPGLVLDPFGGSGTTGVVSSGMGLDCILIDLDERNYELARERIGMFLDPPEHVSKEAATSREAL